MRIQNEFLKPFDAVGLFVKREDENRANTSNYPFQFSVHSPLLDNSSESEPWHPFPSRSADSVALIFMYWPKSPADDLLSGICRQIC